MLGAEDISIQRCRALDDCVEMILKLGNKSGLSEGQEDESPVEKSTSAQSLASALGP